MERRRRGSALCAAVQRSHFSRADRPPRAFRAEHGAAFDAALDQDRRLSRGLRLLSAGGALSHRRARRSADVRRRGRRGRALREGAGRNPLLHGRGMARPQAARSRSRDRDGESRARARHGNLRDARHAQAGAGGAAQGRGARLLQPQHRHLARVLRQRHRHAHAGRSARDAASGARSRAATCAAAASSAWANRAARARR